MNRSAVDEKRLAASPRWDHHPPKAAPTLSQAKKDLTMTAHIDYYFCLNSPWSYMGTQRLADIASTAKATVRVRPVQLGVVLENTGGLALPKRSAQRQAYRLAELERWRTKLGYAINLKPAHFPTDEARAARTVIAADAEGLDALALAGRFGKALWEEEKDLANEATILGVLAECGLDAEQLLRLADADASAEQWTSNTNDAIAAGAFGVPSYVVGTQVLWGQDRLDFLPGLLGN